jgi:hypothetical protein
METNSNLLLEVVAGGNFRACALGSGPFKCFSPWRQHRDKTARMLIRIFDADRSGTIGYQEFCYLWDYLTKYVQWGAMG